MAQVKEALGLFRQNTGREPQRIEVSGDVIDRIWDELVDNQHKLESKPREVGSDDEPRICGVLVDVLPAGQRSNAITVS